MAEEEAKPVASAPVIVAMKGHPGSGKSTVAHAIATALRCPLLDKDDVRDCTLPLEHVDGLAVGLLNELSYAVLWRVAERQVELGLSVVVDSPLSRRAHLDALTQLPAALVVIVECQPSNEEEWCRRLEERGAVVAEGCGDGWHKPKTWAELERLRDGYQGSRCQMAPSVLQPGVPVTLQELEPSLEMFRHGASLRVTGMLQSYDLSSAIAVIQDGGTSLRVNTQHLRDINFRTNSTYQFIGELLIKQDNDACHSPS